MCTLVHMSYIPRKRKDKELLSQYFAERLTADDMLRDALECLKERRKKIVF